MDLVYPTLGEMLEQARPEAVTAFNTIHGHLEVVQACAPRGIHVMVEKPLAVNLAHARQMEALAGKHQILLLTNYETTWYGSNARAFELTRAGTLGELRKIVVHDGHAGPKKIGVNSEFLDWLIDPKQNGGGALTDFGCYGANLITWLMQNRKPNAVTAVTQQFQPDLYPLVEDEATVLLEYPQAQGVIQASWNWPFSRKDMEVYGESGYAICADSTHLNVRRADEPEANHIVAPPPQPPHDDPFSYLAAAVRGRLTVQPSDLSSLENNMIVMEILEAARLSAQRGTRVLLPLECRP